MVKTVGAVDGDASSVWGLDRIDQADLALDGSYTSTIFGSGVSVYVVDTGVDTTHEEFDGSDGFTRNVANVFDAYNDPIPDNNDGDGESWKCIEKPSPEDCGTQLQHQARIQTQPRTPNPNNKTSQATVPIVRVQSEVIQLE